MWKKFFDGAIVQKIFSEHIFGMQIVHRVFRTQNIILKVIALFEICAIKVWKTNEFCFPNCRIFPRLFKKMQTISRWNFINSSTSTSDLHAKNLLWENLAKSSEYCRETLPVYHKKSLFSHFRQFWRSIRVGAFC